MKMLQASITLFAALFASLSAHPYSEWGRNQWTFTNKAQIQAAQVDYSSCAAVTESVGGENYVVRICSDADEASNICFSTRARKCCENQDIQDGNVKSESKVNVGGEEVTVTFYHAEFNSVCYTLDKSSLIGCSWLSEELAADCSQPCIRVTTSCFENTITGDISSCTNEVCQCKEGWLPPDCCSCDTTNYYGPDCKPFCRDNCLTLQPVGGGCALCRDGFITEPECCDCEPGTKEVNGICKCTVNLAEDGSSCKEGSLSPDCCDCDTTGNDTHAFYKTKSGECRPFCKSNCDEIGETGCVSCRTGYVSVPTCCSCDATGNGTHAYYKTSADTCELYCRENCASEGDSGCATCKAGYKTAPKCCDCTDGYERVNGKCVQTKCDKEQDLYFLIDATISYDYTTFCETMVVAQILTAAFNPSSSSGTKLYGALFQYSKSGSEPIEEVFNRDDACNDIVTNDLVTLMRDFYLCKGPGGTHERFDSVCASETIAINGLKKIETVASKSLSKQKALLILTDGTIEDPNNELETVMGSLNSVGIETIIAGRVGTNEVSSNLKRYSNNDQNAVADQTSFGLGIKIVERLSAEGILCEDHAKNVTASLNKASGDTTFTYICQCLPQVNSPGDICDVGRGYKYPVTIKYPTCGGSVDVGISFDIQSQAAIQQDTKDTLKGSVLEEQILAAVEKVLDKYQE